ncbi:MAG: hypothetical protein RL211_2411 [Pseudomonadota bacterium]
MSYILDALKKADLERERGAIPGVHTQQLPYTAITNKPAGNFRLLVPWLIVGLLLLVLGMLAWQMASISNARTHQITIASDSLPPIALTTQNAKPVASPVSAPYAFASTVHPVRSKPEPVNTYSIPVKTASKERTAESKPTANRAHTNPGATVMASKAGVTTDDAVGMSSHIHTLAELPEEVQRDLPKLTISGGTYSSNPAQRLLIVDNQLFLEGSHPAPGVKVEQIRQNAAVLSFRGYRYRVTY